jgi:hypothetical protein
VASNLFSYKTYTTYESLAVFTDVVAKINIGQYPAGCRFSKAEIDFENMTLRLYVPDPDDPRSSTVSSVHDLRLEIDD